MPAELTAVLGVLFGALVGGLINYFASRSVKSHEWLLALAKDKIASRQKLYAEFLVEVQRLVIQSSEKKVSSLSDLNLVTGKFAEVSLVAPDSVVAAAKQLADAAITANSVQPAKEVSDFFRLKEAFILAARKDIEGIQNEV